MKAVPEHGKGVPTSVSKPVCPRCGSDRVVRAGKRQLKASVRQIWRCNGCLRRFSRLQRGEKHTDAHVVLRALALYCEGYSLDETAFILEKKYGVRRSRSCLSKWLKDFAPPYREIRRMNEGCHPVVRSHVFRHRGLNYDFRVHVPKLRFAKRFEGLQAYLTKAADLVPEGVFENGLRCSQVGGASLPPLRHSRHNWISRIALQALRLARHNRERHAVVEEFFLSCDRNTIAAEVPVWHYDKQLRASVGGHIDLLAVNFGKLWVLDFKPHAAKENPAKVAGQISLYARGLSYRTGVRFDEMRCAWFDEEDCYSFAPRWMRSG